MHKNLLNNTNLQQKFAHIPQDASRILYVRNIPTDDPATFKDIYKLFGAYGKLIDVRVGNTISTNGYAFIVFENIFDAVFCQSQLQSYVFQGQHLTVHFYQPRENIQIPANS